MNKFMNGLQDSANFTYTENGGVTWLTHGPEAMDDCSVRTVELGGLPSDSLLRRTLYAAGGLSYTKKASLMTSI